MKTLLEPHQRPIDRARRIYFDRPSYALDGKHDVEFKIKSAVSEFFGLAFRSVVFTGSAQLGFSPHKDTAFIPGQSDLDVACIDSGLFQKYWEYILTETYAFSNQNKFIDPNHAEKLKDQILRRGMIFVRYLPKGILRRETMQFLDGLSVEHRALFKSITVAFYVNEYSFCWKQNTAIDQITGGQHAK